MYSVIGVKGLVCMEVVIFSVYISLLQYSQSSTGIGKNPASVTSITGSVEQRVGINSMV